MSVQTKITSYLSSIKNEDRSNKQNKITSYFSRIRIEYIPKHCHNGCNHSKWNGNSEYREYGRTLRDFNETELVEKAKKYMLHHKDILGFTYNKTFHKNAKDKQDPKKDFIYFHSELCEEKKEPRRTCDLYIKK
jgi:hypothetical protein